MTAPRSKRQPQKQHADERSSVLRITAIGARLLACYLGLLLIADALGLIFQVAIWEFNPFGEIPDRWYFLRVELSEIRVEQLALSVMVGSLWCFALSIARRVALRPDTDICSECGYSTKGLSTPLCPECGHPWLPKQGELMSRKQMADPELLLLCSAGVRLVAILVLAHSIARLVQDLFLHFFSSSVIDFPVETISYLFTREAIGYIWATPIIGTGVAALLWFNAARVGRRVLPRVKMP